MKLILILMIFLFPASNFPGENPEKINTSVFDWEQLKVEKTKSGERRQILEGKTNVFDYFEIHVTTLSPGDAPHGSHVHADMEELIIVKEGLVEQSINADKKLLGPGSVVLALPGDEHGIRNAGDSNASYYIIRWKTNKKDDLTQTEMTGSSAFYIWEDIEFQPTAKGGKRQFMNRPTVLLENLEMHVTTLNEGVTSHEEHVHSNEEIILVIKGEVEESIDGIPHRLGPGSLIFLTDNIPHGIKNAGKGQCEYFAFKWK